MTPSELKATRKRYGLSVEELAALLRISSRRTVMRWEAGEVPISGPASIVLELMDNDELPNRFWP
ncbi:helix-turn-helix domain-containing protein [Tsuneonella sp. HG222]